MTPEINTMLIGGLAALLLALFGFLAELLRRKLRNLEDHSKATRYQVQNAHHTNLRDDIDEVIQGMKAINAGQTQVMETLTAHGRQIEGVRDDLRQERIERLAGDRAAAAASLILAQQAQPI